MFLLRVLYQAYKRQSQWVNTFTLLLLPCLPDVVFSVKLYDLIRVPAGIFQPINQHWSPYNLKSPRIEMDHRCSLFEAKWRTLPPCHCTDVQNLQSKRAIWKTLTPLVFKRVCSPSIVLPHPRWQSPDLWLSSLSNHISWSPFQASMGLLHGQFRYILLLVCPLFSTGVS